MGINRPRSQANGITASLFFISLILGIAAIISLKIIGAHQVIVTVVPVGIMLVYAGLVYFVRRLRLRLDQAGDNLYYLGFLYTLTSLAYSLFEFSGTDAVATSIITNFGIAIWTTITGLALRVLFSQMRTDPVETEHLARVELADASRHLRTELDDAAREFSMFRRSLQQMTIEAFKELEETLNETMRGGLNRFEGSVEQFAGAVSEANKGFEGRSNALRESADKLVGNISTLAERIDAVQVSEDILVRQLQPAINKIDVSAQHLGSTVAELSERINSVNFSDDIFIKQLQPAIDKISEAAQVAQHSANTDNVRAEAWAELASQVATVTNGIHESLKGAQESSAMFVDGTRSVQSAAEQMSSLAEHMETVDLKLSGIVETTDRELKRVVETVIKNLDGLSHQLSLQADSITKAALVPQVTLGQVSSVQPSSTPPQTVQPQTDQPQTIQPQTEQPQTIQPQTDQPQIKKTETGRSWFRFGSSSRTEN